MWNGRQGWLHVFYVRSLGNDICTARSRLTCILHVSRMLDIIQNNPYRVLGLYANSPTKERVANFNRLKAFVSVGKSMTFPLDLPSLLPSLARVTETLTEADARLALPREQLHYAQFWFLKVSPVDDIALNHLMEGNMANAVAIWEKKEDVSSLQNRMVCALIREDYGAALACADKLYPHYSSAFAALVLGKDCTVPLENLEFDFLDTLCEGVEARRLLTALPGERWRQYVGDKTVKPLLDSLYSAIETAKASRGKTAEERFAAGTKLMNDTREPLKQLVSMLSPSDLQYSMLADKLGLEILQCGIDFYNGSKNEEVAPRAMTLQSYAQSVVVGDMARQRCRENVDILQKIIDALPPAEVAFEHRLIREELEKFSLEPDKIRFSLTLLNNTRSWLSTIKQKLGANHPYYLRISTEVVSNALHNVIEEVNAASLDVVTKIQLAQNLPFSLHGYDKYTLLENIKSVLREAWKATVLMDSFDMEPDFRRNRHDVQRSALKEMCAQAGVSTWTSTPVTPPKPPVTPPKPSVTPPKPPTPSVSSPSSSSSSTSSRTSNTSSSGKTPDPTFEFGGFIVFWVTALILFILILFFIS